MASPKGRAGTDQLDQARGRMAQDIFKDWSSTDINDLVRLMRKFADALEAGTKA